jgi:hypothetical protein
MKSMGIPVSSEAAVSCGRKILPIGMEMTLNKSSTQSPGASILIASFRFQLIVADS